MKVLILIICLLIIDPIISFCQSSFSSSKEVRTPDGDKKALDGILSSARPTLVVFWNSMHKDCERQLEALIEANQDFFSEDSIKIMAIYVANTGNWAEISPYSKGKDWEIELYIDVNAELARSLCIPDFPFTILFDRDQREICTYLGYCSGLDVLLCQKLLDEKRSGDLNALHKASK
ncbi:MAG: hypothetical protein IPH84_13945 [Bacteroidales bacterium]|nr:hypothetical protein [Bacteroidales bacterium]